VAEGVKNERLVPLWAWVLIIVGVPLLAAVFGVIIYSGPSWITQQEKASPDVYLKALTDNRTALVQAVGGFAVFLGVIAGALTLRHNRQQLRQGREDHDRDLAASREEHEESLKANGEALEATLKVSRENLLITERGQITDRFSKAIEQLGAAGKDAVDLRLGGIYALEQIARDSPNWYRPVVEVLGAFVRQHASGLSMPAGATIDLQLAAVDALPLDKKRVLLPVDIAAAINVLGRRTRLKDDDPIVDFQGANFCRVEFSTSVNLEGVNLAHARMQSSSLMFANLRNSSLLSSELQGANLQRSDLSGARMLLANLYKADLDRVNLKGANLTFADLGGAKLTRAILDNADLHYAKLKGADLSSVDLSGVLNLTIDQLKAAKIDGHTTLPPGINQADLDAAIAAG
jgi:uncharacterized protein YjbI with pentapeptide repeats